jgi:hypothetical protein
MTISEIHNMSVSNYFISEGQIIRPSTVIVVQVLTEKMFLSDELDSGHYDVLFSVDGEEEERLDVFNKIFSSV